MLQREVENIKEAGIVFPGNPKGKKRLLLIPQFVFYMYWTIELFIKLKILSLE